MISGPNENPPKATAEYIIISGPNENSPEANISVYVPAASSHDGVFV